MQLRSKVRQRGAIDYGSILLALIVMAIIAYLIHDLYRYFAFNVQCSDAGGIIVKNACLKPDAVLMRR